MFGSAINKEVARVIEVSSVLINYFKKLFFPVWLLFPRDIPARKSFQKSGRNSQRPSTRTVRYSSSRKFFWKTRILQELFFTRKVSNIPVRNVTKLPPRDLEWPGTKKVGRFSRNYLMTKKKKKKKEKEMRGKNTIPTWRDCTNELDHARDMHVEMG